MRKVWRENGLSIVVFGMFLVFLAAQSVAGHRVEIAQSREHGDPPPSYGAYLWSGGFVEATFENWESEFLQMAAYVVLTVGLRQKGSAESKKLEGKEKVDADPRRVRDKENAPWPVRRGGRERPRSPARPWLLSSVTRCGSGRSSPTGWRIGR